jgi:hypothetical protein
MTTATMLPFADSFQAGAVLTIVLPLALLISLAVWYAFAVRRVPEARESSLATPEPEVVEAAGPAVTADVTPAGPASDFRPAVAPANAEPANVGAADAGAADAGAADAGAANAEPADSPADVPPRDAAPADDPGDEV